MDWHGACIVPLYKGKGDKYECSNSRGISLLSLVGRLHGRVLVKRVGLELSVQYGSIYVGLGRVDGAGTKCLL